MRLLIKKSQISLFIILGIILLFVVGIGFWFVEGVRETKTEKITEKISQISLEAQPVQIFVEECIKKTAVDSAYEFGQQQGYHSVPKPFLDTNYSNIAYYYYKGSDLIPSNKVLENEFSKILVDNMLIDCADFSIFEDMGFEIEFDDINATTKILDDKMIINVDYPLSIKKGGSTSTVNKFSYTLPFRIGHILDVSRELVDAVVGEPYALDLTLLLNQDVDVSVVHYDNCSDIYILVDNESKVKPTDDDYVFAFAVGLDEQYCRLNDIDKKVELKIPYPVVENHEPVLQAIPYLTANANLEFSYKLNAFDEDNDTLFYLTEGIPKNYTNVLTGLITFTPNESDIGIHSINATVVDIRTGSDTKQFYLEIK